MKIIKPDLRQLLSQAYIFGGSPCSGKSTIAERLSDKFEFQHYKVDDHAEAHSKRCKPERHPVMFGYQKMSWDEI